MAKQDRDPDSAPVEAERGPGHLEDEDIVLLAVSGPTDESARAHAAACSRCAERVRVAATVLNIEPMSRRADAARVVTLLDRLTAVGALALEQGRGATIRVALREGQISVLHTDAEVRIRQAVATRSANIEANLPEVAFFRQLGDLDVEVHLVRTERGRFHLVLGTSSIPQDGTELRFALHRGDRQLSVEPAPHGTASFKALRAGRYRLELRTKLAAIGVIEIEVEARDEEASQ
jgi:hypothetical protein